MQKLLSKKKFIRVVAWLNIIAAVLWGGMIVAVPVFLMFQKTLLISGSDGPTAIYMASRIDIGGLLVSLSIISLLLTNGVLLRGFRKYLCCESGQRET